MMKFVRSAGVCLLSLALWASPASISSLSVAPSGLASGTSAQLLFRSAIADSNVIPVSVNLQRSTAEGAFTNISRLYDDGTHGDAKSGDGVYSVSLTLTESAGPVVFRVSAAAKLAPAQNQRGSAAQKTAYAQR